MLSHREDDLGQQWWKNLVMEKYGCLDYFLWEKGSETVQHEVWRIQSKRGPNQDRGSHIASDNLTDHKILYYDILQFSCRSGKVGSWILGSRSWLQDQWGITEARVLSILAGKWLWGCYTDSSLKMNGSQMRNIDRLREKRKLKDWRSSLGRRCAVIIRDWKIKKFWRKMEYIAFNISEKECFQMVIMLRKWSWECEIGVEWSLN